MLKHRPENLCVPKAWLWRKHRRTYTNYCAALSKFRDKSAAYKQRAIYTETHSFTVVYAHCVFGDKQHI